MFVHSLKLYNFRNLEANLHLSSGLNVIHGRNGQGKTNIIEALHLLSSTKSFRSAKTAELIKWGADEAAVHAELSEEIGTTKIGIQLSKEGKEFWIDDKKVSGIDFVGRLLCVTFSPSDIEIIKGSPAIRRRFLDKHTVDIHPILLKYLLHFNSALKNKISLLKDRSAAARQLDAWDKVLADAAIQIVKARRDFVDKLSIATDTFYQRFAEGDGRVQLTLKSNVPSSVLTADDLFELLRKHRGAELAQHTALIGPQRDEMVITIEGKNSRHFASQGQSKSLALALKLAVIELLQKARIESPVILLDDVDSELDIIRCAKLYDIILEDKRQVFITGTEINPRLRDYPFEFTSFFVKNGLVTEDAFLSGKDI